MSFDFSSLEPRIYEILSAPGTDLSTISAKRVRRRLIELDPTLTVEFFKENREEVDAVIASVFENVSGVQGTEDKSRTDESYKQEGQASDFPEEDAEAAEEEDSPPPKKMRKVGKNGRGLSDAQLARKLSSEINGRSTRTGGKSRGGSGAAGKKSSRAKKSATTVDSDDDGSDGIGKRKKSSSGGTAKGGFAKEFALSDPLAAVLQFDKLSRPQVVKQLWAYIKGNGLQNPGNRREILCDAGLRAVFGVDKIDMFKMNKVLGQHLHEPDS